LIVIINIIDYPDFLSFPSPMSSTLLLLAGDAKTLVCHRAELIKGFAEAGVRVIAAADGENAAVASFLEAHGGRYVPLSFRRSGLNPWEDVGLFRQIFGLIARERPDMFLAYTVKPVAYGTVAAWMLGVPRRFALVPGLGYAFGAEASLKRRALEIVTSVFYAVAMRLAHKVFLQNRDDERLLRARRILPESVPSVVTAGSGAPLRRFPYRPTEWAPGEPVRFLLVSRLLRQKGVAVYAEAARRLRAEGVPAEFHLAGPLDPGPDAVPAQEVEAWQREGILNYHGASDDVAGLLREAHVFVLPTSYREGVPRSVLEALSVGLPVVTTDAVGSRETVSLTDAGIRARFLGEPVREGRNGFLVPPGNADALAEAMRRLVLEPSRISRMGRLSRCLAEDRFDVDVVTHRILAEMEIPGVSPRLLRAA